MTGNRTTELLREGLTKRGIEYDGRLLYETEWTVNGITWHAKENEGMLNVYVRNNDLMFTPEQAITATVGNDQELIDLAHHAWSMAICAMQGMPIPAEWGDAVERGLRKHGINVDKLAGFEVDE